MRKTKLQNYRETNKININQKLQITIYVAEIHCQSTPNKNELILTPTIPERVGQPDLFIQAQKPKV